MSFYQYDTQLKRPAEKTLWSEYSEPKIFNEKVFVFFSFKAQTADLGYSTSQVHRVLRNNIR